MMVYAIFTVYCPSPNTRMLPLMGALGISLLSQAAIGMPRGETEPAGLREAVRPKGSLL